jgi:hypothetical protein
MALFKATEREDSKQGDRIENASIARALISCTERKGCNYQNT